MYDMCIFGDGIKTHLLILKFIFLPNTHAARDRVPEENRDWLISSRNFRARTGSGNATPIRSGAWVRMRMPDAIKGTRGFKRYFWSIRIVRSRYRSNFIGAFKQEAAAHKLQRR